MFIGPLIAVVLARRHHPFGYQLFTVSLIGAFLIGGTLHFIVESPDDVSRLPDSQPAVLFEATAGAVLLRAAICGVNGELCVKTQAR